MAATRAISLAAIVVAALALPAATAAQTSRLALDAVIAADGDQGSFVRREPTGWFDLFGAVRLTEGLSLRARPVVFRRSFDGQWRGQMYELAMRYERPGAVGVRFDAGQFTSPIGLGILENRPNRNPVVSQHSTLYLPIPFYEPGTPTTFLLAAAYPLGAKVTLSTTKWDARVAVIDSSPIRGRGLLGANQPPRMPNYVGGIGFTPYIGVRFGAAYATGGYAAEREVRDKRRGDRQASIAQLEGEWSFNHTRLAGEWMLTRRQLAVVDSKVDGGWIEGTQTLSARTSATVRYDEQWTKWSVPNNVDRREEYRRLETAVAYRLTPDVTLRGSYLTRKGYVVSFWDDQFLASVVWAKKIK